MSSIVRHKIFGSPDKPTIHYMTGYGGTIRQMRPHIATLQLAGFRVSAFEYDRSILSGGDPTLLPTTVDEIKGAVAEDMRQHEAAGVYGISLGTLIGANVLAKTGLKRAMFNTGLVSMADVNWNNYHQAQEKQGFIDSGHDYESLRQTWQDIEVASLADRVKGKDVVLMASTGDTYLGYEEACRTAEAWKHAGTSVDVVTSKGLDHTPAIVRNALRVSRTVKFFKAM